MSQDLDSAASSTGTVTGTGTGTADVTSAKGKTGPKASPVWT